MDILIIGGTVFLGRATVEAALARGHNITIFNRGQSSPDLFPEIERLKGDRNNDLNALHGRKWDAVVDTCGYFPRQVRLSTELLADAVKHYTFISSISVYADSFKVGTDENDAVGKIEDESFEEITGESYGPLKALCEQVAEEVMPGRVANIRPGLIVGPHDPTDRFTYWPVRVAKGGEVLAPSSPEMRTQVIDVRDLAEWNIRLIEAGKTGVFNATGPEKPFRMGDFLEACNQVSGSDAHFTWINDDFLLEQKVAPWMELPMWIPDKGMESMGSGLMQVNIDRALAAGLSFRSFEETIRETLEWVGTRPADHEWRAGMKPEKEAEVLKAWKEANT
ncbi:MAG: SDR family oxidoreductase [Anaerolineaceae bacterium]|nr:SDR family oxidoreductase [Anaerolineaceae bacterium]